MDPSNPDDVIAVMKKLSKAQSVLAPLKKCNLSMLQAVLAVVRDSSTQGFNDKTHELRSYGEEHGFHAKHINWSPARGRDASALMPPKPSIVTGLPPLLWPARPVLSTVTPRQHRVRRSFPGHLEATDLEAVSLVSIARRHLPPLC